MNILREYDFECLPLIDRQFDDPAVQAAVHSIIGAEMRSFAPSDYLAYLPYPELRFASPALEGEMARMAKGQTSEMLDMSRYGAAAPSGRAEQDPVQWRAALRNAQVQVAHQENRVMNAELAEEDGNAGRLWLRQNTLVQGLQRSFEGQSEILGRQIRETNKARVQLQEKAHPQLLKLSSQRDAALLRKVQCAAASAGLVLAIEGAEGEGGIKDPEGVLALRREEASREIDPNDAAHNSTVAEYEKVGGGEGVVDDVVEVVEEVAAVAEVGVEAVVGKGTKKKAREVEKEVEKEVGKGGSGKAKRQRK